MSRRILTKLGINWQVSKEIKDQVVVPDEPDLPVFTKVKALTISADSRLNRAHQPLVTATSGAVLSQLKYGKGRILIGTVPQSRFQPPPGRFGSMVQLSISLPIG